LKRAKIDTIAMDDFARMPPFAGIITRVNQMLWWTIRKLKGSKYARLDAIKRLGQSHDRRALKPLVQILRQRPREFERVSEEYAREEDQHAAITALRNLGCPEAIPFLVEALRLPELSDAAAAALACFDSLPLASLQAILVDSKAPFKCKKFAADLLTSQGWQPNDEFDAVWLLVCRGEFLKAASHGQEALKPLFVALQQALVPYGSHRTGVQPSQIAAIASAARVADSSPGTKKQVTDTLAAAGRRILDTSRDLGGGAWLSELPPIISALQDLGDPRGSLLEAEAPSVAAIKDYRLREAERKAEEAAREEAEEERRRTGWPAKMKDLGQGAGTFSVDNLANDFEVLVGLRRGATAKVYEFREGSDFTVPARGTGQVGAPAGRYEVYFKYSTGETVFKGDSVEIGPSRRVTVSIVKRADGNYHIRGL
jgi:hypothetical protein